MVAGVDIYRATIYNTAKRGGFVPCNNVYWFREIADQGGVGDANLAADLAVAARWTLLRGCQSSNFTYDVVRVQRMYPTQDAPIATFFPPGVTGTLDTAQMPAICSMVLRFQSITPGRSHQGRVYLTGFHNDVGAGAVWLSGYLANVETWAAQFGLRYSGLVGGAGQFQLGIWSPKLGHKTHPRIPDGFSALSTMIVDPVVRLQRSRELGVSRRHAGHH